VVMVLCNCTESTKTEVKYRSMTLSYMYMYIVQVSIGRGYYICLNVVTFFSDPFSVLAVCMSCPPYTTVLSVGTDIVVCLSNRVLGACTLYNYCKDVYIFVYSSVSSPPPP
jgi:hypothetical protein